MRALSVKLQPLEVLTTSRYIHPSRHIHRPTQNTSTHITANMYRQAIARQARLFSTSPRVRKSAVDQAKEAISQVDKGVAQTIVKGIEKGGRCSPNRQLRDLSLTYFEEELTQAAREAANMLSLIHI